MENHDFEENNKKYQTKPYYIGLDIGTDSVGYAVTDKDYSLSRYSGKSMWGVMLFDNEDSKKNLLEERRGYRTARRRYNRRHQRVKLIQELFAHEIYKVDPDFYKRLKQSALVDGDKLYDDYCDNTHKTIHHLIVDLMNSADNCDIRQLYSACAWLVAHRGHFLLDIDGDNVDELTDITQSYNDFKSWFEDNGYEKLPFDADAQTIKDILSKDTGVTAKENELKEKLSVTNKKEEYLCMDGSFTDNKGKGDDLNAESQNRISRFQLIKLLSGRTVDATNLFADNEYYMELPEKEKIKLCLSSPDNLEKNLPQMGSEGELIRIAAKIFDSAQLSKMLNGEKYISERKVKEYETHKNDLRELKDLLKKFGVKTGTAYYKMFKFDEEKNVANYPAYVANYKSFSTEQLDTLKENKSKYSREEFYDYVKKTLKSLENVSPEDEIIINGITKRIENNTYMPKQVNSDNRLIPQQLYYAELVKILQNAEKVFPFLKKKDEYGTVSHKIKSVFTFRIPYYVGPLYKDEKLPKCNQHAWIERKKDGRIYAWNYEDMIDLDKSEDAFIKKMTNTCTYLPEEDVLPKNSLLYCKFNVLNEINNIKIDNKPLPVEIKQKLYNEVFMKKQRVTFKDIDNFMHSNLHVKREQISGIDKTVKSSLKPYIDFKEWLENGTLTEDKVEEIILRITCTTDTKRLKAYLQNEHSLSADDANRISAFKYSDFGRLSKKLLNGIEGESKNGDNIGELGTVIHFMWETNDNLMQIIDSDNYSFQETIKQEKEDYYSNKSIQDIMDEMYLPPNVKKPVMRTLDVLSDVIKTKKAYPEKIFVEMTRSDGTKGERKDSRKDQLKNMLEAADKNSEYAKDVRRILEEIEKYDNQKLQSEKYYLYMAQLGRCMYCEKEIGINDLANDNMYNVDHIWPQAYIKDDSIHNNKVLVCSHENGDKTDRYPVPPEYQKHGFWEYLHKNKLINDIKYERLTRKTPFTDDEKQGFINRQITETGWATKAVATLLKEKYPNTEIVYVKAGNVSEFRHEYGEIVYKATGQKLSSTDRNAFVKEHELVKSRTANDVHHAHDAYLNIVVGNMYHEMFTKKYFLKYENNETWAKIVNLFSKKRKTGDGELVWNPLQHIANVDKTMSTKNMHLVKYQYKKKGGFYDQNPLKARAGSNLVPRKRALDADKYGGYNKPTVSYFVLVRYKNKNKPELTLVPITVLDAKRFEKDATFADKYIRNEIGTDNYDLPLDMQPIRINTVFSLDGLDVCVTGKTGNSIYIRSLTMPYYSDEQIKYIKKVENVAKKAEKNKAYIPDKEHDGISFIENVALYDCIEEKINKKPYTCLPGGDVIEKREIFESSSITEQLKSLENMILYLKTNRAGGCEVRSIDKKGELTTKKSGILVLSTNLSNWTKIYKDVRLVYRSPAGLHEKTSENLLDLLNDKDQKLAKNGKKQ